jgi:cholesterol transport system auxiliary component
VINEPTAILPIDSDRIVIRTGGESVAYLSGAQWSDRLPRLVQTRLIETFERSGHLGRVGRPGLAASYVLVTELRRFEVDVARNEAVVEISARIVSDGAARIVAAQVFTAAAPASGTQGGQAAVALDAALGDAMRRIVAWSAARI